MGEKQNWRELIESYLQAYCQAFREERQKQLSGWETLFLAIHATADMQLRRTEKMQESANRQTRPVERHGIRLVDETTQRVTAEIVRLSGQGRVAVIPFFTTRFVLTNTDAAWLIEAMYHPCTGCNSNYGDDSSKFKNTPGNCFLCQVRATMGEARGSCPDCDGKGTCKYCADEEIPGWSRITSLC
jgi:hypothetical protein